MTTARYVVPDLPVQGRGAFTPAPPGVVTRAEVSSWGLIDVYAAWGTQPIPSPQPEGTPTPSNDPRTTGSGCSPDYFLPAIAVAGTRNQGPRMGALGIKVRSTQDVPVPAVNIVRSAAVVQNPPTKLGGRAVTPWPRVFSRWPSVTQPTSNGQPQW